MPLPRLFVLGDSISIQYGPALQRAVAGWFDYRRKEGLDAAMANLDIPQGANGGDSRMCLAYLKAARDALRAEVLLLNCGLHDLKVTPGTTPGTETRQVPLSEYPGNLERVIDAARAVARHVVWVRTTPVDRGGPQILDSRPA